MRDVFYFVIAMSFAVGSRIADIAMLGQKELVKKPVYLQESITTQLQVARVAFQKSLRFEARQLGVKTLLHVDSELLPEICALQMS